MLYTVHVAICFSSIGHPATVVQWRKRAWRWHQMCRPTRDSYSQCVKLKVKQRWSTACSYAHILIMFTLAAFFKHGAKVSRLFTPGNESSMLLLFLGMKVSGNKFSGTKVQMNDSFREREFYLWNFPSWERKFSGTKVPVTGFTVLDNLSIWHCAWAALSVDNWHMKHLVYFRITFHQVSILHSGAVLTFWDW